MKRGVGKGEISRYAERVSLSLLSTPKHERGGIEEGLRGGRAPPAPFPPPDFLPLSRPWVGND